VSAAPGPAIGAEPEPDADAWAIWKLYQPIQSLQWSAHITRIGDGLAPDFALIDLEPRHWRNPALRPLLVSGLLWMLVALVLTLGAVALRPHDAGLQIPPYLVLLVAFYVGSSLFASYRLGPIFGLLYAGMAALQMLLLWSPFPTLSSLAPSGVAALVAVTTTASLLSIEPDADTRRRALRRRLGFVILAAVLGGLAAAVAFGAPLVLAQPWIAPLGLAGYGPALGLSAALCGGFAAWWRRRAPVRALVAGAACGLGASLFVYSLPASPLPPGGLPAYLSGPLGAAAAGTFFSGSYCLAYAFAHHDAGPRAAVLAGVLAGAMNWLVIDMATHASPLHQLYLFSPFIVFMAILAAATYVIGQWRPAQAAQVELITGQLARLDDIEALGRAHAQILVGNLANGAGARLRNFSLISLEVAAALSHTSTYSMRLALGAVLVRLDDLIAELRDSSERYAGRFHPVALRWREIVAGRLDALARALEQDIANPYVVGVPLTAQDAIFVGRMQIAARLEQSLRARHSPPVLLYGQRRMGKSSLLLNLARLLPESIIPLYVDGQAIAGASHYAEFLYHLAGQMVKSARAQRRLVLPALALDALTAGPFTAFSAWLDAVEAVLERENAVALLALDEFEVLMRLLDRRINTADFTDLLRHLIQHRPRFKLVLAGSHTLEEFFPLAGALINLEVLKITYLTSDEARHLIEHPVKDFALGYTPAAVQAVLELARGHPYLLQLLCYELIWLKNEQPPERRYLAEPVDVGEAAGRALATGATFFAALQNECADAGALAVLRAAATSPEEGPPAPQEAAGCPRAALAAAAPSDAALDDALKFLLHHDVLETADGGYRFQVELVRRWFAQ
jgi:hypothetical protein